MEVRVKMSEELQKAFADFKAANDEALAGKADVVLTEKVDRINSAVSEIQDRIEEANRAAAARMDEIELAAGRRGLGAAGKDEDRDLAAQFHVVVRGENVTPSDADVEAYRAYKPAFSAYLRRGDAMGGDIRAALSVGSDPDGGYWVEPAMSNDVVTRLFETSPMRSVASVITIGTDAVEFPNDTNDATLGGWVGEKASRSDTATPQIGKQRIEVHEQYAMPNVTQKLLDDAAFPVESWLANKIADKLARTENTAFVSGGGVTSPRGFTDYAAASVTTVDASRSWGVLQHVVSGAAAGFPAISGSQGDDPDALIDVVSALKPAYRQGAVWLMNRTTEAALRKFKDLQGNYLIRPITDGIDGWSLSGFRIVTMEDMANIGADAYPIAFGNFNEGYLIVDRQGVRVLRDPYTNKPYVRFYTTKRVGGDVVNFDAIKLLKISA